MESNQKSKIPIREETILQATNTSFERNIVNLINQKMNACELLPERNYLPIEYSLSLKQDFHQKKLADFKKNMGNDFKEILQEITNYDNTSTKDTLDSKKEKNQFIEFPSRIKNFIRINYAGNTFHNYLFPLYVDLNKGIFITEFEDIAKAGLILRIDHLDNPNSFPSKKDGPETRTVKSLQAQYKFLDEPKVTLENNYTWFTLNNNLKDFKILVNSIPNVLEINNKIITFDIETYKKRMSELKEEYSRLRKEPDFDFSSNLSQNKQLKENAESAINGEIRRYRFSINSNVAVQKIQFYANIGLYANTQKTKIDFFMTDFAGESSFIQFTRHGGIINAECDNFSYVRSNSNENNFHKIFKQHYLEEYVMLMETLEKNKDKSHKWKNLDLKWFFEDFILEKGDKIFIEVKNNLNAAEALFQLDRSFTDNIKFYPNDASTRNIFIAVLSHKENKIFNSDYYNYILDFLKDGKILFILDATDEFLGFSLNQLISDPTIFYTMDITKTELKKQGDRLESVDSQLKEMNTKLEKLKSLDSKMEEMNTKLEKLESLDSKMEEMNTKLGKLESVESQLKEMNTNLTSLNENIKNLTMIIEKVLLKND
jgi:hypothetical protein